MITVMCFFPCLKSARCHIASNPLYERDIPSPKNAKVRPTVQHVVAAPQCPEVFHPRGSSTWKQFLMVFVVNFLESLLSNQVEVPFFGRNKLQENTPLLDLSAEETCTYGAPMMLHFQKLSSLPSSAACSPPLSPQHLQLHSSWSHFPVIITQTIGRSDTWMFLHL